MTFTAAQIALMIQGKVEGNPAAAVGAFGKIEEAKEGELSFLSNPKYEEYLYLTKASVIICNESLELKQPTSATLIRVADAYSAFAILLSKYQEKVGQHQVKHIVLLFSFLIQLKLQLELQLHKLLLHLDLLIDLVLFR